MLKNVKFRVWNDKSAKMWPVDKMVWSNDGRCHPVGGESYLLYSDSDILMQSIGMADVNGVGIFENDIVKFACCGGTHRVIYEPPRFKTASHSLQGYECEVIGNVFENPDILEIAAHLIFLAPHHDLKLFVWTGVLTNHSDGIMFAMARTFEEARTVIRDERDKMGWGNIHEIYEKAPEVVTSPKGFILWGGE